MFISERDHVPPELDHYCASACVALGHDIPHKGGQ